MIRPSTKRDSRSQHYLSLSMHLLACGVVGVWHRKSCLVIALASTPRPIWPVSCHLRTRLPWLPRAAVLMQALPSGSMAAVHCAPEKLRSWIGEGVEVAAINAPELCTVSGPATAVAELLKRLEANNIEFRPLHTSHAFHSGMMEAALGPFTDVVRRIELRPPRIPYVSNVTGTWITAEQAMSPTYYAATFASCRAV